MENGINLGKYSGKVRETAPVIHNITNYVTVNDCANILLACGASPIMSDDCGEVEKITSICTGLVINIGTLNQGTITAMTLAGKKANEIGIPVVFDPVGAGASQLRTKTAQKLIDEIKFTVIRGNISEIKTLALGSATTKGVDANVSDLITDGTVDYTLTLAKNFSDKTGAVVAITGAIDIVTDVNNAFLIKNGHPMMSKITGSGCMLSAMIAAYLVANPENTLEATAAAVAAMGLCGETAQRRISKLNKTGSGSFRTYLLDEVFNLEPETLTKGADFEFRRL